VTAPLIAKALPSRVTPVVKVMLVKATILPTNLVPVPRVAELPTCQNMFGSGPPSNVTKELDAVVRVEPIKKWKGALGVPVLFSVSVPVN